MFELTMAVLIALTFGMWIARLVNLRYTDKLDCIAIFTVLATMAVLPVSWGPYGMTMAYLLTGLSLGSKPE